MKGYYNNPDATAKAIDSDGWLHSGDEASIDADGYVRITGRIKDLIIRGGENISPKEIEDCLREHPAVADAYVYGLPDDFFGEIVAAAVRLKADTTEVRLKPDTTIEEQLILWCAERLARFKVPKYVRLVSDFPMTASGKIQKYKLAGAASEQSGVLKRPPAHVHLADDVLLRHRSPVAAVEAVVPVVAHHEVVARLHDRRTAGRRGCGIPTGT